MRLRTPDIDGAEASARSAFSMASALGDEDLVFISLQNVAGVTARRGHPQAAARLSGSIETWRNSVEYRPRVSEELSRELLVAALNEKLGPDTQSYIALGKRIPLERATNEALATLRS